MASICGRTKAVAKLTNWYCSIVSIVWIDVKIKDISGTINEIRDYC